MISSEKSYISNTLSAMAEIYGKTISTAAIIHMVESISDLDYMSVVQTLHDWSKTEKSFPYPADIRAKIFPENSDKDDAQDVANFVISAVSKFGYTNPTKAKEYIGDLGWEVVSRMGGWKHLCETLTLENEGMLRAQIREYTFTVSKRAKRGELELKPELPQPNRNQVQKLIGETFK